MAYTTIDKPTDYFNTKTWSGASGDLNITNLDFQPDWVWIKSRNTTGADHKLVDAVRGNSKSLKSNETEAESTDAEGIQSFNSDGYTLGDNDGNYNRVGRTYVGWNWKANGSGSSNTDGSITSSVSANTTAGFSIVSYTANAGTTETIGHGLGAVPSVIIVKRRSTTADWIFYHKDVGNDGNLKLNTTNAKLTGITWRSTTPTSSVFTVGEDGGDYQVNNPSGGTFIAYCFAEKKGFSKFGSYTGNGSTDGTFVYTGFKPAFVLVKRTDSADHWFIWDSKRSEFNQAQKYILPSSSNAESDSTSFAIDILSNGFKLRVSTININASGSNYIYMAFAESPFTTSTGIPTTAR